MATQTAPRDWWDESDEVLATVLQLLEQQAKEMKRHG